VPLQRETIDVAETSNPKEGIRDIGSAIEDTGGEMHQFAIVLGIDGDRRNRYRLRLPLFEGIVPLDRPMFVPVQEGKGSQEKKHAEEDATARSLEALAQVHRARNRDGISEGNVCHVLDIDDEWVFK